MVLGTIWTKRVENLPSILVSVECHWKTCEDEKCPSDSERGVDMRVEVWGDVDGDSRGGDLREVDGRGDLGDGGRRDGGGADDATRGVLRAYKDGQGGRHGGRDVRGERQGRDRRRCFRIRGRDTQQTGQGEKE